MSRPATDVERGATDDARDAVINSQNLAAHPQQVRGGNQSAAANGPGQLASSFKGNIERGSALSQNLSRLSAGVITAESFTYAPEERVASLSRMSATNIASAEREDHHGTWWTAAAHIICAVIGAGVLSLSFSLAYLGWIAGPIFITVMAAITWWMSNLLADCYIWKNVVNRTYYEAVYNILGRKNAIVLGSVQHTNLVLTAIAYAITSGSSLRYIDEQFCSNTLNPDQFSCSKKIWFWVVIFAAVQLVLSQVPNLEQSWALSMLGAVMSFGYAFIALGIGLANLNGGGSIGGIPDSPGQKVWNIFNSLGAVAFAFSFCMVLVEVQDTVREPVVKNMRKAVAGSLGVTSVLYLGIAITGYVALGNDVPGNILTGFGSPRWLLITANIFVVVHLVPAYQVYSQPFFAWFEGLCIKRAPHVTFFQSLWWRLIWRSAYVLLTCLIAILLPFFNDFVGLVGALGFFPITVYYPTRMWCKLYKPGKAHQVLITAVNIFSFFISLLAIAGSLELIGVHARDYDIGFTS